MATEREARIREGDGSLEGAVLTEASIKEIAASFEKSPATIEGATFFGGEHFDGAEPLAQLRG